jgi:hypothetical protein
MVGPPLDSALLGKSSSWLVGFLSNPDSLLASRDSIMIRLTEFYGHMPHQNASVYRVTIDSLDRIIDTSYFGHFY